MNKKVASHLGDKSAGRQSTGRQTNRATTIWATNSGRLCDTSWVIRAVTDILYCCCKLLARCMQGCTFIYRTSTRPSAHDYSLAEKCSLLAHAVSITRSATPHHLITSPHSAPPRPRHGFNLHTSATAADVDKLLLY